MVPLTLTLDDLMTLPEACGAGSNHQSYERLQLDNGASYRNVVNTKHVRTISLNLALPKKLTPDDPRGF